MKGKGKYCKKLLLVLVAFLFLQSITFSQIIGPELEDSIAPMPSYEERAKKWGPNDTIIVSVIWFRNEMMPYQ